jgi:hypothetical protein
MDRSFAYCVVYLVCSCTALLIAPSHARSAEPLAVHVDNWPEIHKVKGSVSIDSPISHTKFVKKEAILVPPSRRGEPTEMTGAGTVDADGFTSLTMSLQGEVKGSSAGAGSVGVLLIPDEAPIQRAFREARRIQYAIENSCNLNSGDPIYFSAEQVQQRLSFPRYRIYLYNTTNRSVEANLYLTYSQ